MEEAKVISMKRNSVIAVEREAKHTAERKTRSTYLLKVAALVFLRGIFLKWEFSIRITAV